VSEPTVEEIESMVSSIFEVVEIKRSLDSIQFQFVDKQFKSKFVELAHKLESKDLVCKLERTENGMFILVRKFPPRKTRKWLSTSWTPRILFVVVVCFVMVDGYYRTVGTNNLINIGDPLEIAGIYTLSLLGILGIHESGHLLAAKFHKLKTTWPYFIPGIPIFGIPTFGAFIQSKGVTINREILFDVAIAGPIAGLIITVIVSFYGAYTAPIIDDAMARDLFASQELVKWNQGEPLLMLGTLAVFGKGIGGHEVLMTPILFAAWIGFLITFLNLLPAWQLDGGHMARTLVGEKWHKIATYGSMGILFVLGYWFMALLILMLSSKSPAAQPLDDISPLPRNRKISFIAVIVLAVLCAPLPASILP